MTGATARPSFNLSLDQVLALAPDASAAVAGKKLGTAKPWRNLGGNDDAYWGECEGSAVYQVRVARADLAAKCSCPSRKLPCKHSLGLLVLAATAPATLAATAPPEWVAEWLARRGESAARKAAHHERTADAGPADLAAQAERAAKRLDRVRQGIDALHLWLADLVRQGLGGVVSQGPSFWERPAARLVDAQAPGLAARLRRLGDLPRGDDWAPDVLAELGRIALLIQAFRHADRLDDGLGEDVRQLIGWTTDQEEVLRRGERVADQWAVIGQSVEDEDRLKVQRSWLVGAATKRPALVLQFAAGNAPFAAALVPGTAIEADLSFFPGAAGLRALIGTRRGAPQPLASMPAMAAIDGLLADWSRALAVQPWLDRFPATLEAVVPARAGRSRWHLRDAAGASLPLTRGDHWQLLALSGGHPVDVAGEWDGRAIQPLGIVTHRKYHVLGRLG